MKTRELILGMAIFLCILSCKEEKESYPLMDITIEKYSEELDAILADGLEAEILASGLEWTEGPLWVDSHQMLLFSEIPTNTVYKWTEEDGQEVYLEPSGYTTDTPRGGEVGSNGLLLSPGGKLVLCQHGDRRMAMMDADLSEPKSDFITLADNFEGKKLNSPNDAVYDQQGNLYFTDPPYGLEGNVDDPAKELPFQGVYKVDPSGAIHLLTDSLTRPNGIGFLPGEKTLIIANSDSQKPFWYAYDLDEEGAFTNGRIFHDASEASRQARGMPDGLKVDKLGNVFATGPGGIWIFNQAGTLLGKILVPELTSNCYFGKDGKVLFVTADDFILRLNLAID